MQITLNFEPIVIKDEHGNTVIEAQLFDLYYFCGNVLAQKEIQGLTAEEKYGLLAEALNEKYGASFTWGSASRLVTAMEETLYELKKNGEVANPHPPTSKKQSNLVGEEEFEELPM